MKRYGILLVILGASLWGTDSLFRRPLSQQLSPVTIVFLEHCLLSLVMLPFLRNPDLRAARWQRRDVAALVFISVGGSVVATSLFTYAIKYGNPSVVVLLQKTQPVFASLLARALLGERPGRWFWYCLIPALAGAYLVSMPDWQSGFSLGAPAPLSILAALGTALLWGASTVFGRYILARVGVLRLTGLRFVTALPVLLGLYLLQPPADRALPATGEAVGLFLAMALISSLAGLLFYYRGLQETRASIASVAEMVFPLTAVAANWLVLDVRLSGSQLAGAGVLVAAITALAYLNSRRPAWRKEP